jgi:hypothetical protein
LKAHYYFARMSLDDALAAKASALATVLACATSMCGLPNLTPRAFAAASAAFESGIHVQKEARPSSCPRSAAARARKVHLEAAPSLPAQYVKPYVKRGKNDVADAEAICAAVTRPTVRQSSTVS